MPYSEFVKASPDIIRAAAQSLFGILALLILVIGVLALVLFKGTKPIIRLAVFVLVLVSAFAAFATAIAVEQRRETEASVAEQALAQLKQDTRGLVTHWERVSENAEERSYVRLSAPRLIKRFEPISDDSLPVGRQVTKHKYLALAHVMLADTSSAGPEKISEAEATIAACDKLLALLDGLDAQAPNSKDALDLAEWARKSSFRDAANYTAALALAIGTSAGRTDWRQKGKERLDLVTGPYKVLYGEKTNPIFASILPEPVNE